MAASMSGCNRSPYAPLATPPNLEPLPAPTPYETRHGSEGVAADATHSVERTGETSGGVFMAGVRSVASAAASAVKADAKFRKTHGAELVALEQGNVYIKKARAKASRGGDAELFDRLVPAKEGGSALDRSAAEERYESLSARSDAMFRHRDHATKKLSAMIDDPRFPSHFARLSVSERLALATDLARAADGTHAAQKISGWLTAGLRGEGPLGELKEILARAPAKDAHGHTAHGAHAEHAAHAQSLLAAAIPALAAAGNFHEVLAHKGHLPGLALSPALKVGGAIAEVYAALKHLGHGGTGKHPSELAVLAKSGVELAEVVAHAKGAHHLVAVLKNAANVLGLGAAALKVLEAPIDSSNAHILANAGRLAGYALALFTPGGIVAGAIVIVSELVALFTGNHGENPIEGALARMGLCKQKH